jgi:uncharacterized membrane protein YtjA (UPF0391 family)
MPTHSQVLLPQTSQWGFTCRLRRGWLCPLEGIDMLHWTLMFLIIALVAGILGFGGIAGTATGIAKILFFVFLVVWLMALLLGRRSI